MHDTLRPKVTVPLTFQDGPDMFHTATETNMRPGWTGARTAKHPTGVTFAHTHDEELYKVRTQPHLYEEWHVAMVEDQREAYLSTLPDDVIDWDCHHCKHAVITQGPARCPNCGWQ